MKASSKHFCGPQNLVSTKNSQVFRVAYHPLLKDYSAIPGQDWCTSRQYQTRSLKHVNIKTQCVSLVRGRNKTGSCQQNPATLEQ